MTFTYSILLAFMLQQLAISGYAHDKDLLLNMQKVDKVGATYFEKEGWKLANPVIYLENKEVLTFRFDLFSDRIESLDYTYIHCNRDWKPSGLSTFEIIDGFPSNRIEEATFSFNTSVNYVHYKIEIPGRDTQFRISGNYLLLIHRPGEEDNPLITRKFIVAENKAVITGLVSKPTLIEKTETHQQLNLKIGIPGLRTTNPAEEVTVVAIQNGDWTGNYKVLKPDIITNEELRFSALAIENLFAGGNEFRQFDIKSRRYQTENVRDIVFYEGIYQAYLFPEESREFKPYFYRQDFNGKYIISNQEGIVPDNDSDYFRVFFTLKSAAGLENGEVFVTGELTNWERSDRNRMIWDSEQKRFELSLLLKQGWYNYTYCYVDGSIENSERWPYEGSHYETENDYAIVVYFRRPYERYERVVGYQIVNSSNRPIQRSAN